MNHATKMLAWAEGRSPRKKIHPSKAKTGRLHGRFDLVYDVFFSSLGTAVNRWAAFFNYSTLWTTTQLFCKKKVSTIIIIINIYTSITGHRI
jgi:hypothetical protein